MTFTAAEQVQRMLGLFGLASQAINGMVKRVPMPLVEDPISDVAVLAAITWTHTPTGGCIGITWGCGARSVSSR